MKRYLTAIFTVFSVVISTVLAPFSYAKPQLPSEYKAYEQFMFSPSQAQLSTGICWAFTHNEVLQANIAKATGKLYNFSEQTIKFETSDRYNQSYGYNRGANDGGSEYMSTAFYARGGVTLESDEPFSESLERTNKNPKYYGYLKSTQFFDYGIYNGSADLDQKQQAIKKIKELVYTYGAVGSAIYSTLEPAYYNSDDSAFYYNGIRASADHSVTIVGWDDNYSKQNFNVKPEYDGAFIVKNSWGDYHANNSSCYVYVSYYDKIITQKFFTSEYVMDNTLFDRIYQHDQFGWTGNGAVKSNTALCVTKFCTKTKGESLSAVSTYVTDADTTVEVYVNTSGKNLNDQNAYKKVHTQHFDSSGYYLMEFDKVKLSKSDYYVGVKFMTKAEQTSFAMQYNIQPVANAKNIPNTCFVAADFLSLTPIEQVYRNQGFEPMLCIKAFTSSKNQKSQANSSWNDEICEFLNKNQKNQKAQRTITNAVFIKALANLSGQQLSNNNKSWYQSATEWAKTASVAPNTVLNYPHKSISAADMENTLVKFLQYMNVNSDNLQKIVQKICKNYV